MFWSDIYLNMMCKFIGSKFFIFFLYFSMIFKKNSLSLSPLEMLVLMHCFDLYYFIASTNSPPDTSLSSPDLLTSPEKLDSNLSFW